MSEATAAAMLGDPPTLTPEAAFAFATTWRNELRGCVKLEAEASPESLFSIAEWVSFSISSDDNRLRECGYARATTIVWFALSCCKGFSGAENPQFWQRILSRWSEENLAFEDPDPDPVPDVPIAMRLAREADNGERPAQVRVVAAPAADVPNARRRSVDAARRALGRAVARAARVARSTQPPPKRRLQFFPNEGFPRIRLKFGHESGIRTFLGLLPTPVETTDSQVRTILEQLAPFIREAHWQRHVPVAVDANQGSRIPRILTEWLATESEPIRNACKFGIKTIVGNWFLSPAALASLDAELPLCGIEVLLPRSLDQNDLDEELFRLLLRRVRGRSQSRRNVGRSQLPQWRISRVVCTMGSTRNVSTLYSALPHIQSVQGLDVRCATRRDRSASIDWAWLGYAVFHPAAASHSAVASISIEMHSACMIDLDAFESMARGNNHFPEGQTEVSTDQYVEAFIETTTSVWTLPVHRDGSVLQSNLSKSWVTVCVSSIEEGYGQDWLCIVNPGIGFGYIRGSDISEWRSRPPGQSSIRSLRIEQIPSSEDSFTSRSTKQKNQDERVMRLLRLVGGSLTALDWQGSQHISTSTMLDLRMSCPRLKYLRVGHGGAVWADPSGTTSWQELEELEIDLVRPQIETTDIQQRRVVQPIQRACLPTLRALKLNGKRNSFRSNKDKLQQILQDHKTVEFLCWSSKHGPASSINPSDLTAKREFERYVQEMELSEVITQQQLTRRLSFLSVVSAKASWSFDVVLCALVFSFEPRVLPREIYVDL